MPDLTYLDLDLEFERVPSGYRVTVTRSPAGSASAEFVLPFSDIEIENVVLKLGGARRRVRRIDSPEMQTAKQFGGKLFNAVFVGDVRGVYAASMNEASTRDAGLRLRLHLDSTPELADLPWEYLYNPSLNRFLALSVKSPIVRFINLPEHIRPLLISPPLQILAMISSPQDYETLDVEREWAQLQRALSDVEQRGLVSLERLDHATLSELQRKLQERDYHVFHFIGHGGYEVQRQDGVLILENEQGRGRRVSAQTLGAILHDHNSLRLAVLNSCEGARTAPTDPFAGVAQSLVQQGIPAVIAMQFEISDDAAATFASGFYQALARGYPVDAASAEVRKTIFGSDNEVEWGTPVLYLRAPDGKIFDVRAEPPAPVVPVAPGAETARPPPGPEPARAAAKVTPPATAAEISAAAPTRSSTSLKKIALPLVALAILAVLLLGGYQLGIFTPMLGGATPTPGASSGCIPVATYVTDVTLGDNPVLAPGEQVEKIWEVENTGNCAWSDAQLVHMMGQGPDASTVKVPNAAPGENVQVRMQFSAPNLPGEYASSWRLQMGNTDPLAGELHLNFRVDGSAVRTPAANGVTIEQRGTDRAPMVLVGATTFSMGSTAADEFARADEKPQHPVTLNEFWIDQFEVTNAQYAQCVSAGACEPPEAINSETQPEYYEDPKFARNPVLNVTWYHANSYCSWAGKYLPTEAQWELAARGTESYRYPWGNDFDESKLNFGTQIGETREVEAFPGGASPYGARNMAGNVWEWVWDRYGAEYYGTLPTENPQGPEEGETRVQRGGSWRAEVSNVRGAARKSAPLSTFSVDIGFRCAQ